MEGLTSGAVWGAFGAIVVANILLSGDNAVVIALACRALPRRQRAWGIIFGAAAAVLLRIVFTVGLQFVLELPYLRCVGGVALLWIAVKLLIQEEAGLDAGAHHIRDDSTRDDAAGMAAGSPGWRALSVPVGAGPASCVQTANEVSFWHIFSRCSS